MSLLDLLFTLSLCSIPRLAGSEEQAWFTSKPEHFQVKVGADIAFPCLSNGTGGSVISWSWNGRLITAGETMVFDENRLKVVEGGRQLYLRDVQGHDTGEYVCTYNLKYKPITLNHQLDVLVAPSAKVLTKNKEIIKREGDKLELRCQVTGYPLPSVAWYFKDDIHPVANCETLVIEQLTKDQLGEYECRVDNSEGRARDAVLVNVHYKPLVTLKKRSVMNSDSKSALRETVFSCAVQANPKPTVKWYKNGFEVDQKDPIDLYRKKGYIQEDSLLTSYTLKIKKLEASDYGNYSCEATNAVGTSASFYPLSGSPDQPTVLSSGYSRNRKSYRLLWSVWTPQSFPILNQSILYRKIGKAGGGSLTGSETTWHNLALISERRNMFKDSYSMDLSGLDQDSEYEVRIRAMNSQGWSPLSPSFSFRTTGDIYQPMQAVYFEGHLSSGPGSTSSYSSPTNVVSLVLIALRLR